MKKHIFSKIDKGQFSQKDNKLIKKGLLLAKNSLDSSHGVAHIKALRDFYLDFRKDNGPKVKTDDRVMAHSIVFHDIYKMQTPRSKGTLGILLEEAYEGLGSAKIFRKHAIKTGLENDLIKKIAYAIRKHSTFNLLPRSTNEAKLLFDLDDLEGFNIDRFKQIFNEFKFSVDTQVKVATNYIAFRSKTGFYYDWSREMFEKRKNKFLEEFFKLRDDTVAKLKLKR